MRGVGKLVPPWVLALGVLFAAPAPSSLDSLPPPRTEVIETQPMHIDRLYPSMTGPSRWLSLDDYELDWVTAYRTEVVRDEDRQPMGGEFFCHSQVQLPNNTRLLVTATGMDEIRFPEGFAMPFSRILAGVPPNLRRLTLMGMVLNNYEPMIDQMARVRTTIEYLTDDDVGVPPRLQKLYTTSLPIIVEDLEGYTPPEGHEVNEDVSTHCVLVKGVNGHWMVPPGPQTTRRRFDKIVPIDGTLHYAVVHLHNYGVYMRLTDATTGAVLWQTDVVYEKDRPQIAKIPVYSSTEGIPLYEDHAYEVEAFYDNRTDHDVDAMAVMYLYYHPKGDADISYTR